MHDKARYVTKCTLPRTQSRICCTIINQLLAVELPCLCLRVACRSPLFLKVLVEEVFRHLLQCRHEGLALCSGGGATCTSSPTHPSKPLMGPTLEVLTKIGCTDAHAALPSSATAMRAQQQSQCCE